MRVSVRVRVSVRARACLRVSVPERGTWWEMPASSAPAAFGGTFPSGS